MRRLYDAGKDDREIAAELGTSFRSVWLWRQRNNLSPQSCSRKYPPSPNKSRKKSTRVLDEPAAMVAWLRGKTDAEIVKTAGGDLSAVAAWRRQYGLSANLARKVTKGQAYELPAAAVEAKAREAGLTYGQYQAREWEAARRRNVPLWGTTP